MLILLVFLLDAIQIMPLNLLHQLDLIAYDARTLLTMPSKGFPGVTVVDIDEKSLEAEGRWPWRRDKLALLVDRLVEEYQVAAVGFDVIFAERDESSGLSTLEFLAGGSLQKNRDYQAALQQLRPQLDRDGLFRDSLKNRPVVLGYYFTNPTHGKAAHVAGRLPKPFAGRDTLGNSSQFVHATGYGANLPALQEAAADGGHINPFIDQDGKIRRVPLFIEYGGNLYPSLALALVRQVLGSPPVVLQAPREASGSYRAIESVQLGGMSIPVDEHVRALVPFRGKAGTFQYVSASDVLHKRVPPSLLQDSIVLVGTTAPGLLDLRSTPVANAYPGVEIHASLIAGMLEQSIKHTPGYVTGLEVLLLLVSGLLLIVLLPRLDPVKAGLLSLALLALLIACNLWAWQAQNLVIPLAQPVSLVAGLYVFYMTYGFITEAHAKRQISSLFGQYVPPELVREMSQHPESWDPKCENREMTVLFSDIRDFTSISENLDPEMLSQLLNIYLTRMTEIIHKHRGTVDKYIGDAIMAFWGAPLSDPQHAAHAVAAALEMQQAMTELREKFQQRGWPALHIGIGINSGTMSVGNMGSNFRKAYTVLGDEVNLASRLEGLTKYYGVDVLIGEHTAHSSPDLAYREIDTVRVKGKGLSVKVYQPAIKNSTNPADETGEAGQQRFNEMLSCYRLCDWDGADKILQALLQQSPDSQLYRVYRERIARFRQNPPPDGWDGVFEFRMK